MTLTFALLLLAQATAADTASSEPVPLAAPGLENLHRLSPRVYSGGTPQGDPAFVALRKLGVRTVISVDGAPPDAEAARRQGLRTIHLPVGYDGIDEDVQRRLARAVRDAGGPVYVHCHHGKHRGPAAAAIGCVNADGWTPAQVAAWLATAGTSTRYPGLHETAATARPIADDLLSAVAPEELPERAEVPSSVERMAEIDLLWEEVQSQGKAEPREVAGSATLLWEAFREFARADDPRHADPDYRAHLDRATEATRALAEAPEASPELLKAVADTCTACHAAHRDRPRRRKSP
jgi:protein tyrosine phosphatase (PTP) superfamily phosphohydrolase (DUF442 family)